MNPRLRAVLSARDLPLAELTAARLDGDLYPQGDGWCPLDLPDGPHTRAASVRLLVPARAIAERMTAAWIHGVSAVPSPHQFCVDHGARAHLAPTPRIQLREVSCPRDDVVLLGGLRVTAPLRTLVDLARTIPDPAPDIIPLLAALLDLAGATPAQAIERILAAPQSPNKVVALQRLRSMLTSSGPQNRRAPRAYQPSLTRYTS